MKKIFLLVSALFCAQTLKAQIPSSCVIPSVLQTNYDFDVKYAALKLIYSNITSPYRDSIKVPEIIQEPIWEGLAAIYNLTTVPERDSAIDNYCIHQQPSDYLFHDIFVAVDTSFSWTHQWQNLNSTTGIISLDNLLTTYGFTVTHFSTFGSNYATLTTAQNINVRPLCDSIATFSGVLYAEPSPYVGDGNKLTYIESGNDRIYHFTLGLGDCPSGCTEEHTFMFKVFPDCAVTYLGTFSTATYLPIPPNCNITTNIENEKTQTNFNIYPNPATDKITIEVPQNTTIEILNINGQIIQMINKNGNKMTIDLGNLSNGVFIIKAKTDKGITIKKFIKE